jgi:hypothetical protein
MKKTRDSLTAARLREILNYDPESGIFTWRLKTGPGTSVGSEAGGINPDTKYRLIRCDGVRFAAHRLAWLHVYGWWPAECLDHVNGHEADNRIANLRECTNAQNQQNRKHNKNNTSGYRGVSWRVQTGRWQAYISHKKVKYHLGFFDEAESAHQAYVRAKANLHEFEPGLRA